MRLLIQLTLDRYDLLADKTTIHETETIIEIDDALAEAARAGDTVALTAAAADIGKNISAVVVAMATRTPGMGDFTITTPGTQRQN